MSKLYDKRGIPIERGDVLKVYHFTAALRRKRHYMYKHALGYEQLRSCVVMRFSHLDMSSETYFELSDGRVMADYEIVQSADCKHEERPGRAALSALEEGGQ